MSTVTRRSLTLGIEGEPPLPSEGQVFEEHAVRLLAAVRCAVCTSPVNVEDACAFAWLQSVRCRPGPDRAFPWLRTTAIREAIKLDRRAGRLLDLDRAGAASITDPRQDLDRHLDVLAAVEELDEARLRPREAAPDRPARRRLHTPPDGAVIWRDGCRRWTEGRWPGGQRVVDGGRGRELRSWGLMSACGLRGDEAELFRLHHRSLVRAVARSVNGS